MTDEKMRKRTALPRIYATARLATALGTARHVLAYGPPAGVDLSDIGNAPVRALVTHRAALRNLVEAVDAARTGDLDGQARQ